MHSSCHQQWCYTTYYSENTASHILEWPLLTTSLPEEKVSQLSYTLTSNLTTPPTSPQRLLKMLNHVPMKRTTLFPSRSHPLNKNDGTNANTNSRSVFSRERTLANTDRRGLSQVNFGELVDLADITVYVVSRVIHPYTFINRIRWFMLKACVCDRGAGRLFSASPHQHWVVLVEQHVCCVISWTFLLKSLLSFVLFHSEHVEQDYTQVLYSFALITAHDTNLWTKSLNVALVKTCATHVTVVAWVNFLSSELFC